ncbi:hypothetical protein MFE_02370 [Mycoplasmopsis fermentans JER]|nr:hypothetical protein MFE_02370 [Mycoplasmopsis fermentans JER]
MICCNNIYYSFYNVRIGKLYTKDLVIHLMNLVFVFLHIVLQWTNIENMQVTMVWKGVQYLLGTQFLGSLIGFC